MSTPSLGTIFSTTNPNCRLIDKTNDIKGFQRIFFAVNL